MKTARLLAWLTIVLLFFMCAYISVNAQSESIKSGPITQDGGISAPWVLVTSFTIIGALITFIINDMKKQFTNTMKAVTLKLKEHDNELIEHGKLHAEYKVKFESLRQ